MNEIIKIKISEIEDFKNHPYKVELGDDLNDLPMFLDKGLNVAVDNAMQDLKNKADFITLSCKDDAIAHLIEKIINNEL